MTQLRSTSPADLDLAPSDADSKARHRAMWESGDYASMVETWLLPLGTAELEAALDRFCDEWDRSTAGRARFELEYLLAVGTRA